MQYAQCGSKSKPKPKGTSFFDEAN